MNDVEISACCYSEKEDVSIGFGIVFDADKESVERLDNDWLWVGISESFWENCEEFEHGIDNAKKLLEVNSDLTYRQALYRVFGDFNISYEVEGKEFDLSFKIDVNEIMYGMLENV